MNQELVDMLNDCDRELAAISGLIVGLGPLSQVNPYLSKYAVIKACGCIELVFKNHVNSVCARRTRRELKNYLRIQIVESSMNPSYDNIIKLLKKFSPAWDTNFRANLNAHPDSSRLKGSLKSLVDLRNEFAHGGSPAVTIGDAIQYFRDAREILNIIDRVVV